ncbi:type IV pilus secretin PilQ [bacterium]|nr:type IV pilus secretin PilQ [bacterium]
MRHRFFANKLLLLSFMITVIPFSIISCKPKFMGQSSTPDPASNDVLITDIKTENYDQMTVITLYSNRMFDYTSFVQQDPPAIVLEMPNVYIHRDLKPLEMTEGNIQKVVPEQVLSEDSVKAIFTIQMSEILPYEINREEGILKISMAQSKIDVSPAVSSILTESESSSVLFESEKSINESNAYGLPPAVTHKKEILRSSAINIERGLTPGTSTNETPETPNANSKKGKLTAEKTTNAENDNTPFSKKEFTGKPISLDFQNADIQSVLRIIADVSGHNLVIDPEVQGKVNITLMKPVPWDQALDVILRTNKLSMKMEGNIIRIGLPKTFTAEKEAELEAIKTERKAKEESIKAKPLSTKIVRINYAKADVLMAKLTPMLSKGEGLAEPPSIMMDERTNTLIIKDLPSTIEEILKIIETLDRSTPQVMIEARIVETNKNFAKDLGIQWGGTYSKQTNYKFVNTIDVKGTTGADNFAVNLPISSDAFGAIGVTLGHLNGMTALDIQLKAMEQSGKGKVISNPRILTLDNEQATIKSGTKIPYQTTDAEGNPSTNFVDAAINLTVTPQITPDNNILMRIQADKSEPDWGRTVNGAPSIITRTATTRLIVMDEDTAVIGGLYQQNEGSNVKKVPILGDIPILGHIFKTKDNNQGFDELLIFITPRVIKSDKALATK